MPHDDATLHHAFVVDELAAVGFYLLDHCGKGFFSNSGVVADMGKGPPQLIACVFEIGEPNVDDPLEGTDGFCALISARVVDDGDAETLLTSFGHRVRQKMGPMRSGNEIDVVRSLVLQLQHDLYETLWRDLDAEIACRDLVVLTVDAFERTAAEKDGP